MDMPVGAGVPLREGSDGRFEMLEYELMGVAYDVHNTHGRLCDERVYRNLIADGCKQRGMCSVNTEVPILVCHEDFEKTYYVDLLIDGFFVVELKTVNELSGGDQRQTINYLLLGLRHGKLINMRSPSVEGLRVRTRLTPAIRRELSFCNDGPEPVKARPRWFRTKIRELLEDWGGFLSLSLYHEAITHFLGGPERVEIMTDYLVDNEVRSSQRVRLLDEQTAFSITAVKDAPGYYENHLKRLVEHTPLQQMEWVNMADSEVTFKTLE
jgi:GxxExxY protein